MVIRCRLLVHTTTECALPVQKLQRYCCVLQTEVTQEQSMALVEYIAHLSLRDWAAVPEDLRRLGFISADAPDSSVIAEPLGRILGQISIGAAPPPAAPYPERQSPRIAVHVTKGGRRCTISVVLSAGGGAKGVNLDQITRDIEALTESYPFEIPGYFALILRCFSVLGAPPVQVLHMRRNCTSPCCTSFWNGLVSSVVVHAAQQQCSNLFFGGCCRGDRAAGGPQLQHRAGVLPVPGAAAAAGQRPPHPGMHSGFGCTYELVSTGRPQFSADSRYHCH